MAGANSQTTATTNNESDSRVKALWHFHINNEQGAFTGLPVFPVLVNDIVYTLLSAVYVE